MVVAYPTPHRLRRNFTLYPYAAPAFPPPWGDDPSAPPAPTGLMVNTTMTKENVDYIVDNYEGDYFGFQTYFENVVQVSLVLPPSVSWFVRLTLSHAGASFRCSLNHGRVSGLQLLDLRPARCFR